MVLTLCCYSKSGLFNTRLKYLWKILVYLLILGTVEDKVWSTNHKDGWGIRWADSFPQPPVSTTSRAGFIPVTVKVLFSVLIPRTRAFCFSGSFQDMKHLNFKTVTLKEKSKALIFLFFFFLSRALSKGVFINNVCCGSRLEYGLVLGCWHYREEKENKKEVLGCSPVCGQETHGRAHHAS